MWEWFLEKTFFYFWVHIIFDASVYLPFFTVTIRTFIPPDRMVDWSKSSLTEHYLREKRGCRLHSCALRLWCMHIYISSIKTYFCPFIIHSYLFSSCFTLTWRDASLFDKTSKACQANDTSIRLTQGVLPNAIYVDPQHIGNLWITHRE